MGRGGRERRTPDATIVRRFLMKNHRSFSTSISDASFFFPWIPRMYSDCAARVHTSARWFTSLASFDDYDVTSGANLPLFTFNRNQLNLTAIDSYWNQQDNFQFPHQRHRYDIVMTSSNRNPLHYLMVAVQASTAFERSIQFITRV